jgi:ubiquinone biosynthesis monooxygenase Coq7
MAAGAREAETQLDDSMANLDSWQDRIVGALDEALRTLAGHGHIGRPNPGESIEEPALAADERAASGALMRVNHAGEIAAQALYSGQAVLARSARTREHLRRAGREEQDHLGWCRTRLAELGTRPSLLTPAWYGGAFAIGLVAGAAGDRYSLGFIAETERQVEAHIKDHLVRLPARDTRSAAILEHMAADEAHHGTTAQHAGGLELPIAVKAAMRLGGEILRRVAEKV